MSKTRMRGGYAKGDGNTKRNFCNVTSKVCYRSRSDAKATRRLIKRKERREGTDKDVSIYQCPHCRDYHVGTRRKGKGHV